MRVRIDSLNPDENGRGLTIGFRANSDDARGGQIPDGFDPWALTFDEVFALGGMGTAAFSQWAVAQGILQLRHAIENDADGIAVLKAINMAAHNSLVAPQWLADAFLTRFLRFERHECGSLDEAFGHTPPTERTRIALQEHRRLLPAVSQYLVAAIHADPRRPIDIDLFAEVGELLGIGKTRCRELYDEGVKEHNCQDLKQFKRLLLRDKKSSGTRNSPVFQRRR